MPVPLDDVQKNTFNILALSSKEYNVYFSPTLLL